MKTSTSGSKSFAGWVSFRTLAPKAVVDEYGDDMDDIPPPQRDDEPLVPAFSQPPRTTRRPTPRAKGENARAVDARARERADLEKFIVGVVAAEGPWPGWWKEEGREELLGTIQGRAGEWNRRKHVTI